MSNKPMFAAAPARVIGAANLSSVDLRVLMAVAAHDRLGANGVGCFASHSRLAQLVGCHIKSLSRSLAILADSKFIAVSRIGRQPVYKVIYNDFDAAFIKAIGNRSATDRHNTIGNEFVVAGDAIGNNVFGKGEQDQRLADDNILGETLSNKSRETTLKRGNEGSSPGVGAMLAMLERSINAGKSLSASNRDYLQSIADQHQGEQSQWARRLMESAA